MKRLTRQTMVAGLLAGAVWLVVLGLQFAPSAKGQEPAKPGTPARTIPPSTRSLPPGEPDEDDETSFRDALAHKSLLENCLICHTEDVIAGQRLTPVQWKAEVDKMVGWGSPLPKEDATPLIDYLARHYSDRSAPPILTRAALKGVGSLEVPASDQEPAPAGGELPHGRSSTPPTARPVTAQRPWAATSAPAWLTRRSWTTPRSTTRLFAKGDTACPASRPS